LQNRILSMLGLAEKSGNIASGEFSTEQSIKKGKSYLVIVATDASDNTKKQFMDMTAFYEVPCYLYGTKEELGSSIGKVYRASLSVNDENFAKALEKKLQQDNGGN